MKRSEGRRNAKHLLRLSVAGVVAAVVAMLAAGCFEPGPVRCGGVRSSWCNYHTTWSLGNLYANTSNTINIFYDVNHPFDSVIVAVSHGTATKGERPKCQVFVPDSMIGRTVTVYSLVRSGSGYDTLSHIDYRVVRLPDPDLVLGILYSGLYPPEVILKDPVVRAYNFDYDFTAEWEVVSYRVTLTDKDSTVLADTACVGNALPEEVREAVRRAPVYSEVRFREVVVRSGEEVRELEGFTVYVDIEE